MTKELFQMTLNVTDPWFVKDLKFDIESKRLDIYIDFKKGNTLQRFAEDFKVHNGNAIKLCYSSYKI